MCNFKNFDICIKDKWNVRYWVYLTGNRIIISIKIIIDENNCFAIEEMNMVSIMLVYVIHVDSIHKAKALLCILRTNLLSCEVVGLGNLSTVLIL